MDLDITILGRIYEKNLSQIKAKSGGVFYTPADIAEFISKNAILEYLEVSSIDDLKNKYSPDLLKEKIENLKILDPSCGCGIFLIKSIDVIYEITKAMNIDIDLSKIIYGIDVDEKAVEIARMTVFLKLKSLGFDGSLNIKCVNALIDFKTNLKFDIVVANPPYINIYKISQNKKEMEYYQKNYISAHKKFDLYVLFLEKALTLLKKSGILGFIIPNNFTSQPYGYKIRQLLLTQYNINRIIDLTNFNVFRQNTSLIILFAKNSFNPDNTISIERPSEIPITTLSKKKIHQSVFRSLNDYSIRLDINTNHLEIIDKIKAKSIDLGEICFVGVGTRAIPQSKHHLIHKESDDARKLIVGKNILKNYIRYDGLWLNYIDELHNPRFPEFFENEKIVIRDFLSDNEMLMAYDTEGYYTSHTTVTCLLKSQIPHKFCESEIKTSQGFNLKYIYGVLMSRICEYCFKILYSNGMHVYVNDLRRLPVFDASKTTQKEFVLIVDSILYLSAEMHTEIQRFHKCLDIKLSRKLKKYYNLTYDEFSRELDKKGVYDDFKEEFMKSTKIVNSLSSQIQKCEDELNQKFYNLYKISKSDISEIENYLKKF